MTDPNDTDHHDPEADAREGWLGTRLQELRRLSRIPGVNLSEETARLQGLLSRPGQRVHLQPGADASVAGENTDAA